MLYMGSWDTAVSQGEYYWFKHMPVKKEGRLYPMPESTTVSFISLGKLY